ncbi:hypothetical protein PI126_g16692 [Phytophthora idaei]|nr:hypothetical protein PI126_g16692 [Phytophthora idaei]
MYMRAYWSTKGTHDDYDYEISDDHGGKDSNECGTEETSFEVGEERGEKRLTGRTRQWETLSSRSSKLCRNTRKRQQLRRHKLRRRRQTASLSTMGSQDWLVTETSTSGNVTGAVKMFDKMMTGVESEGQQQDSALAFTQTPSVASGTASTQTQ